jgi:hypothetical protein
MRINFDRQNLGSGYTLAQHTHQESLQKKGQEGLTRLVKQGIWAYFLLLIFEGAFRKWFLPSLATPLLIVRDPIALFLLVKIWQRGMLLPNIYLVGTVLIGILGIFTATLLGHGNLLVALFGARILLFHFPFMFVIGRFFNRDDVIKIGKTTLWISIPMTLLIAIQFYSPQSAWVNLGVGGDTEGAGFSGALGYFRPPATFSFTNGTTLFFSLVSCFIFYFWFYPSNINRLLLISATVALLIAVPLSISRSLFFQVGVALAFALMAISRKPEFLFYLFLGIIGGILILLLLSHISFFQTATEAFTSRFEAASETEGGLKGTLVDRFLGGMIDGLNQSSNQPFFGYGLGMGTNVGSMLLTGGRSFLIAEGEWGRLIGELGPLMGIAIILIRLGFSAKIALASYSKLVKGDLLPWMLLSFGLVVIPQGQWAQPTSLGFSTLIGGLILASLRSTTK